MASGRGTKALVMAAVPTVVVLLLLSSPVTFADDVVEGIAGGLSETAQNIKEKGESIFGWARTQFSGGLHGSEQDNAKEVPHEDQNMAEKLKVQFTDPASAAAHVADEKWEDAKDAVEAKVGGISYELSQGTGNVIGAFEKAESGAEKAKDSVKEKPKGMYEASKEKLSQATGDLGSKMNEVKP